MALGRKVQVKYRWISCPPTNDELRACEVEGFRILPVIVPLSQGTEEGYKVGNVMLAERLEVGVELEVGLLLRRIEEAMTVISRYLPIAAGRMG